MRVCIICIQAIIIEHDHSNLFSFSSSLIAWDGAGVLNVLSTECAFQAPTIWSDQIERSLKHYAMFLSQTEHIRYIIKSVTHRSVTSWECSRHPSQLPQIIYNVIIRLFYCYSLKCGPSWQNPTLLSKHSFKSPQNVGKKNRYILFLS